MHLIRGVLAAVEEIDCIHFVSQRGQNGRQDAAPGTDVEHAVRIPECQGNIREPVERIIKVLVILEVWQLLEAARISLIQSEGDDLSLVELMNGWHFQEFYMVLGRNWGSVTAGGSSSAQAIHRRR